MLKENLRVWAAKLVDAELEKGDSSLYGFWSISAEDPILLRGVIFPASGELEGLVVFVRCPECSAIIEADHNTMSRHQMFHKTLARTGVY